MKLLTVTQAAARLGVSPMRVRQLISDGTIAARHVTEVHSRMKLIDPVGLCRVKTYGKAGRPKKPL